MCERSNVGWNDGNSAERARNRAKKLLDDGRLNAYRIEYDRLSFENSRPFRRLITYYGAAISRELTLTLTLDANIDGVSTRAHFTNRISGFS